MFDWNENDLQRGKPELMDTPTLIEWIQRQLETVEETESRIHALRRELTAPQLVISGSISPNEARRIRETFEERVRTGHGVMYVPDGCEVTEVHSFNGVERLYIEALDAFRAYQGE